MTHTHWRRDQQTHRAIAQFAAVMREGGGGMSDENQIAGHQIVFVQTFSSIKIMKSVYISALFIGFVSSLASAETYPDLNGCYRCFNNSCSNSNQFAKIVQNSPGDLLFYNERRPSLISSGKFISENRVMAYSYRSDECGPPMIATLSYYPTPL